MSARVTAKIKINNQVVIMRKHVKQAKVHAINRLTKEVKLLQNRKGNADQVAKAKRKAERFLAQMDILKKMKPDHVSKLALSKSMDWKEVLQKKNSALEDRCVALLASYDAVQKEVEKFHSTHLDLVCKIPDLIKEWEEKFKLRGSTPNSVRRTKKLDRDTKSKGVSGSFENTLDKIVFLETGNQEVYGTGANRLSCDRNDLKCDTSSKGKCEINQVKIKGSFKVQDKKSKSHFGETVEMNERSADESCSDDDTIKSDQNGEEEDDVKDNESETKTTESSDEKMDDPMEVEPEIAKCINVPNNRVPSAKYSLISASPKTLSNANFKKQVPDNKMSAENNLKTIAVLNLENLEGLDEIPVDKITESEQESDDDEKDSNVNDPFFLGRDEVVDKEKPRIFPSNVRNLPKHDYSEEKNSFKRNEKISFGKSFRKIGKQDFTKSVGNSRFPGKEFNKADAGSKFGHERNFKKSNFQSSNEGRFHVKDSKKFHPKDVGNLNRRERRRISATGKMSFEEHSKKSHFRSEDNNSSFKKNKIPGKKGADVSAKPLHPSWEAKRKQKELTQTAFQGKRMVFND